MHTAGSSIEEVPFCFSRSSVKFQGHTALKIAEFDPDWAFPDCNSSFNSPMATKWCTKAWSSIEEVPYCFSRSSVKLQGHTAKKIINFWPKLGVSGLLLKLEFTDGYKMMHRAWSSIVEVPYCFSRSSIKFQGHTGQNITDFDPNWAFPVAAFKSLRFAFFYICLYRIYKKTLLKSSWPTGNFTCPGLLDGRMCRALKMNVLKTLAFFFQSDLRIICIQSRSH